VIERLLRSTSAFTLDPNAPAVRRPSISLRRHVSMSIRMLPS
jgi:hypothetical protein